MHACTYACVSVCNCMHVHAYGGMHACVCMHVGALMFAWASVLASIGAISAFKHCYAHTFMCRCMGALSVHTHSYAYTLACKCTYALYILPNTGKSVTCICACEYVHGHAGLYMCGSVCRFVWVFSSAALKLLFQTRVFGHFCFFYRHPWAMSLPLLSLYWQRGHQC